MPNKSNHKFLRGEALLLSLVACTHPVKWLRTGVKTFTIEPAMALCIARAGVYEGKASPSGRLFYIREIDQRPLPLLDSKYWDDRAVIRYQADQTTVPQNVRNKAAAAQWDRILRMDPPPKSWRRAVPV